VRREACRSRRASIGELPQFRDQHLDVFGAHGDERIVAAIIALLPDQHRAVRVLVHGDSRAGRGRQGSPFSRSKKSGLVVGVGRGIRILGVVGVAPELAVHFEGSSLGQARGPSWIN
jgi:hypothetical protein